MRPRYLLAAAAALLLNAAASAQAPAGDLELRVKSALLFNLARFVTWPAEKFAGPDGPIEICLRETEPIAPALAAALADKTIDGRALALSTPVDAQGWSACHIAYFGGELPAAALAELPGHAVLTVHEGAGASVHGVVRLFLLERKLRFEINSAAARRGQLQLSSRLMSLASIVEE